jgi:DNA-binding CsgD family transcriptional regulator
MPHPRGTSEVVAATTHGLNPAGLRESLIGPLQRLLGVGPVFLASADPVTGLITGASNSEIPLEASQRFLANEYAAPDIVKFRDVAAARVPAQSLYAAAEGDPAGSARWRDILEPLGWGDELRVALRDRTGVWGYLCLHRGAGDPSFTPAELAAAAAVVPQLAAAFRRTALAAAGETSGAGGPGVVLLGENLDVVATTGSAEALLDEWRDADPAYPLPVPIAALAARLLRERAPQRLTMRTPGGQWIGLHAGLLDGPGSARVAVVVETPAPAAVLPVFAALVGLTARESEVAAALLRGQSNRLIARGLQVSEQTLQTQVRSVFSKAGVHSRSELTARLLGGH